VAIPFWHINSFSRRLDRHNDDNQDHGERQNCDQCPNDKAEEPYGLAGQRMSAQGRDPANGCITPRFYPLGPFDRATQNTPLVLRRAALHEIVTDLIHPALHGLL